MEMARAKSLGPTGNFLFETHLTVEQKSFPESFDFFRYLYCNTHYLFLFIHQIYFNHLRYVGELKN